MTDPSNAPARPGLRERKKARTRAAIQTCAMRLFREQGYDATTIAQIIEAADVSETTFFRYFPTKEDLVLHDDYDPMLIEAFQEQPPVPALRASFAAAFTGITARAGRRPDGLAVRTVAGAVVGAAMAVSAAVTDDPDADLPARLEPGLVL
ncbi:TetR/AcrR family transcriptional regulator [Actinomadura napierensis]|uniref:HTH tetR-type domain-containing protein n=1 Tax=Actinomadura napierensis TaxID=267854 RepID=A0ABP5LI66_9ACTN